MSVWLLPQKPHRCLTGASISSLTSGSALLGGGSGLRFR